MRAWSNRAFELALSRPPTASERSAAIEFLKSQTDRRQARDAGKPAAEVRAGSPGRLLPGAVQPERVPLCRLRPRDERAKPVSLRPRGADLRPPPIFSQRAGGGLGMLALADLLGGQSLLADDAPADKARRLPAAALPGQGQGGDLAVHGRGAQRRRPVRSQAGAGQEATASRSRSTSSTAIPAR